MLREAGTREARSLSGEIKEGLLDACARNGLADVYLSKTLEMECQVRKRPGQRVFQAKPQIWLDCQSEAGS